MSGADNQPRGARIGAAGCPVAAALGAREGGGAVTLATRVMSTLIVVLGLVIVVAGAARGDILRVVIGLLFVAAGAGRLYLQRERR